MQLLTLLSLFGICEIYTLTTLTCSIIWLFFFFKQKTAYEMRISDWSSDVCSSDLLPAMAQGKLTLERVFASPDLSGPQPRALKLSPDGKLVTLLKDRTSVV